MKIARAVIENFRHIERLELDFTDSLDRVRPVSLIVGPNGSGKTTILDALAVTVGLSTGELYDREGFKLNPRTIVRRGSLHATVTCWVRFSREEIDTTRKLFELAEDGQTVPNAEEVRVTWVYPSPDNAGYGQSSYEPETGWALFKGRAKIKQLLAVGRVGLDWFQRVGGTLSFDQQRTGVGRTILRDLQDFFRRIADAKAMEQQSLDPRSILLALAAMSKFESAPGANRINYFELIQQRYAQVCAPRTLVGVQIDKTGSADVYFSDGNYEYSYDGLSSGEQMWLLFLIRMVSEQTHQSIVLVDEIELHQHPIWQRRLLHLLPKIGEGNQIIATSHSEYIQEVMPRGAVIHLGALVESPQPVRG